jgi:Uma2 family endonuclease
VYNDPDCDFVDGELEVRNAGKYKHSRLQAAFTGYLFARERLWGIRTLTEQRLRLSSSRIRIPDVCVLLEEQPRDEVIADPPFLCVEIVSPDDSLSRVMIRLNDYLAFGVPNVWLIDPDSEHSYVATTAGLIEAHDNILRTANPEIVVPVSELFQALK